MAFSPPNTPPQHPPHHTHDRSANSSRIPLLTSRSFPRPTPPIPTHVPNPPPPGYPVWVFICGYPWWPAKVIQANFANKCRHESLTKQHDKILIEFFDENKHTSFVPICCLRNFLDYQVSDLNPENVLPKLETALQEAQKYVQTVWASAQPNTSDNKPGNEKGFRPVKRYRTSDQSPRFPFSSSPSSSRGHTFPARSIAFRRIKAETQPTEIDKQPQNHALQQINPTHQQTKPENQKTNPPNQDNPTMAMVRLRDAEIFKLHRLILDMRLALPEPTQEQLPQVKNTFGPVCRTAAELLGRCSPIFVEVSKFLKRAGQSPMNHHMRKKEELVVRSCRGLLSIHIDPTMLNNYGMMYILKAKELAEKSTSVSMEIHLTLTAVARLWENIGGLQSELSGAFETNLD